MLLVSAPLKNGWVASQMVFVFLKWKWEATICLGFGIKIYLDILPSKRSVWSLTKFACKRLDRKGISCCGDFWNHKHQQWHSWYELNQVQKLNQADKPACEDICRMIPEKFLFNMQTNLLMRTFGDWSLKTIFLICNSMGQGLTRKIGMPWKALM